MRDIVSCFSENSINVTNPSSSYSCSSLNTKANINCISPTTTQLIVPSPQNAVTSIYKLALKNDTRFLATVTWSVQCLTVTLANQSNDTSFSLKLNLSSRLFRRRKGTKSFQPGNVEVSWDFAAARFDSAAGPEPSGGFSVVATFDSEVGLALGDAVVPAAAAARLVSRHEHCSGTSTVYATRARFSEKGTWHDIVVRCGESEDGAAALSVAIDKNTAIRVKRLQWNFRGNQTIFVDGLLVDLLWDVHDWFFKSQGSFGNFAIFMFRTRSGLDSRLWLEEKLYNNNINNNSQEHDTHDQFSLLIYACKTSQ